MSKQKLWILQQLLRLLSSSSATHLYSPTPLQTEFLVFYRKANGEKELTDSRGHQSSRVAARHPSAPRTRAPCGVREPEHLIVRQSRAACSSRAHTGSLVTHAHYTGSGSETVVQCFQVVQHTTVFTYMPMETAETVWKCPVFLSAFHLPKSCVKGGVLISVLIYVSVIIMGRPLDIKECSAGLQKIITSLYQQIMTVSPTRTGSLSTEGPGVGGREGGAAGSAGEKSPDDTAEQLGGRELRLRVTGALLPSQPPLPSLCQLPATNAPLHAHQNCPSQALERECQETLKFPFDINMPSNSRNDY